MMHQIKIRSKIFSHSLLSMLFFQICILLLFINQQFYHVTLSSFLLFHQFELFFITSSLFLLFSSTSFSSAMSPKKTKTAKASKTPTVKNKSKKKEDGVVKNIISSNDSSSCNKSPPTSTSSSYRSILEYVPYINPYVRR